ncbi:MAG: sulfur carrier protein ThiS [Phycisphaerae bacterium]|nr:sulfur carrier protein ThiS [Phycisphaerae bacterium]
MRIFVNGREEEVRQGESVRALIERMNLGRAACAAEVNKRLVPRKEQETTELREGDRVELVSLVGGG